ncbi:MAG: hypothetical protein R3C56_38860 [Pirellulaceae bacterium]
MAAPRITAIAASLFFISIPIAFNLGAEFMPRLNEGDLLVEAVRLPSRVAGRCGADGQGHRDGVVGTPRSQDSVY